jgi:hypothetical protein
VGDRVSSLCSGIRVLEIGTTPSLAISGHHVAVLAAVIYFALRAFALAATVRICARLILIWHYILAAGAPPPTSRAGGCRYAGARGPAFRAPSLAPALYKLTTTPVGSASPQRWVRSRRSRWRWVWRLHVRVPPATAFQLDSQKSAGAKVRIARILSLPRFGWDTDSEEEEDAA